VRYYVYCKTGDSWSWLWCGWSESRARKEAARALGMSALPSPAFTHHDGCIYENNTSTVAITLSDPGAYELQALERVLLASRLI